MKKIIFLILIIFSCSSENKFLLDKSSILNYEDNAKNIHEFNIDTHFFVRVDIDSNTKPRIIKKIGLEDIEKIYRISNLQGMTLFYAHIDKNGNVQSSEIIKSAGLGLDDIAEKILKGIKFKPITSLGKEYDSKVYIRIGIKGRESL